ncbi:MAG: hypothetical protein EXQ61_02880 [Ilumatobacteraceae bacterium]|nr:hypothetical protein [Ilumatobacteraceae bacterium]
MTLTVTPDTYNFVAFDTPYTARIAERMAAQLGLDDVDILIAVNENSSLTRIDIEVTGSLVTIAPHSGAMEDTRRPRQQSELNTTITMARGMLRVRDRLRGGFADAPADTELSLPQAAIWDTYIMGRIAHMDIEVNKQAWVYNFRNRHGFSDAVDVVFEKVWNLSNATWAELSALSANTLSITA